MNILMLSITFPYPPTRGGTHCRTFNLLQGVSKHHAVTLITQRTPEVTEEEIEGLRGYVKELVVFDRLPNPRGNITAKLSRMASFWLEGIPPNVSSQYSHEIQAWVDEAVEKGRFDAITAEHSVNEMYIRPEWKGKIRTILNVHSSIYRTCKNQLETNTSANSLRDRLYLPGLYKYEQRTTQKFSHLVVTTNEDEEQFKEFNPNTPITTIPNGVDLEVFPYRHSSPKPHHLVFFGGLDYFVNIDAACFLAREILSLVQKSYPDATLALVGSKPSEEVQALGSLPGVTVTGRVPSIVEYLHEASIAVMPLRTGFGMKIKTVESMAAGVPVVGSDRALEGLDIDNLPKAIRANSLQEYVEAIIRLWENPPIGDELARNARRMIEELYTWQKLADLYEGIIVN